MTTQQNNQNDRIFEVYKPFRNYLRACNLLDSLHYVWAFSANYTFNIRFPSDIELPEQFNQFEPNLFNRKYRGIFDHEIDFLTQEIIINCSLGKAEKSLKKFNVFKKIINYLRKDIVESVGQEINLKKNIFLEFNRIAHNQFKWQLGYGTRSVIRYYKIYSEETLTKIIYDKLGLTPFEIFSIGIILFNQTGKKFLNPKKIVSPSSVLPSEKFDIFLQHFSTSIETARQLLTETHIVNETLLYSFNSLQAKPILIDGENFLCPIPMLIYFQITSGIYYSICMDNRFSKPFGFSFQNYIGDVIYKSITNKDFKIFPEASFGSPQKETADWLIIDNNSILFIECKGKRMTYGSKSNIDTSFGLEKDIDALASFILQLYKTHIDYKQNLYPQVKYDESKIFIPLVLTLEDWGVNFNHQISDMLKEKVVHLLKEKGIDPTIIDSFPYYISCASDFERDIQLINFLGIQDFFKKLRNNEIPEISGNFEYIDIHKQKYIDTFISPFETAPSSKS